MFLNNKAQILITNLRDCNNGGVDAYKASVSDAMSIIVTMHEVHADTDRERKSLINTLSVLSDYNDLLTALSKEK